MPVDHLPDFLVQLVFLPNAVRGTQQHRRNRNQANRPAHRRIDPLMTPKADAYLTLRGGEDHRQRVGDAQQLAPQALLARLHHRAVSAGLVNLCLELLGAEVVRQRTSELLRRDGGAIDPLDVQRRTASRPGAFGLLFSDFASLRSRSRLLIQPTKRSVVLDAGGGCSSPWHWVSGVSSRGYWLLGDRRLSVAIMR